MRCARTRRIGIGLAVFALVAVAASTVARAETEARRSGVFLEGQGLPGCPSNWDRFKKKVENAAGDTWKWTARAGKDIGNWSVDQAKAYEKLTKGDPDAFIDEFNKGWNTTKDTLPAAAIGVVSTVGMVAEILPGGKVKDFMRSARKATEGVVKTSVDGMLKIVEGDFKEVGNDAWYTLKGVTDPLEFAKRVERMSRKWGLGPFGSAYTLAYLFTEDDLLTGVEKAARAYYRQRELFGRYGSKFGFARSMATAAMSVGLMREYDRLRVSEAGKALNDKELAAGALAVAAVTARFRELVEAEGGAYYDEGEIVEVPTALVYAAFKARGGAPFSFWRPVITGRGREDCISLGDTGVYEYNGVPTYAVCGVEKGRDKWWSRPIDFTMLWSDRCSGATMDGSVWVPICKPGFRAIGFVAGGHASVKPLPHRIACLSESMLTLRKGKEIGLRFQVDDGGSGARFNISVLQRDAAGMKDLSWFDTRYGFNNPNQVAELEILQTVREFRNNGAKRTGDWPPKLASMGYVQLPGSAVDISIGANGDVWVVGTDSIGDAGWGLHRWAVSDWQHLGGVGSDRIAVDPDGFPWTVDRKHAIHRFDGKKWVNVPGQARDIGIGADGSVWIVGSSKKTRTDYGFYAMKWSGGKWPVAEGPGGVRIAVDPKGNPWVVSESGEIHRYDGRQWERMEGTATDIGIGGDGTVWVVMPREVLGGFAPAKWTKDGWEAYEGGLTSLAVGPKGEPWGVNTNSHIFRSRASVAGTKPPKTF